MTTTMSRRRNHNKSLPKQQRDDVVQSSNNNNNNNNKRAGGGFETILLPLALLMIGFVYSSWVVVIDLSEPSPVVPSDGHDVRQQDVSVQLQRETHRQRTTAAAAASGGNKHTAGGYNATTTDTHFLGGQQQQFNSSRVIIVESNAETPPPNSPNTDYVAYTRIHEWGPEGINIDAVVDFWRQSYYFPNELYERDFTDYRYNNDKSNSSIGSSNDTTTDSAAVFRYEGPFPALLAVLPDQQNISLYVPLKIIQQRGRYIRQYRWRVLSRRIRQALASHFNTVDYPHLARALQEIGMIPLIFQLDDFRGCVKDGYELRYNSSNNNNNGSSEPSSIRKLSSLPKITLPRTSRCGYSFPMPDGDLIQTIASTGFKQFQRRARQEYPWYTKVKKAVWRGKPSGNDWPEYQQGSTMMILPHRQQLEQIGKAHSDIMDVAIVSDDRYERNESGKEIRPMENYQRYRAIIDIDGHSWSNRFPVLLCYNSIVIRIVVKYGHYMDATALPHVHYIPASLENISQVVEWAVSGDNEAQVQSIIRNANQWCLQHMQIDQVYYDLLSLLEGYVRELDRHDEHIGGAAIGWKQQWKQVATREFIEGQKAYYTGGGFLEELPKEVGGGRRPKAPFHFRYGTLAV